MLPCILSPDPRLQDTQHFSTWLDMIGKIDPNVSHLGDGDAAQIHSPRGKVLGADVGPRRIPANLTLGSLTERRSVAESRSPKFPGIFTKWRSVSESSSPTSTRPSVGPRRLRANMGSLTKWRSVSEPSSPNSSRLSWPPRKILPDFLCTPAPPHAVLRHTSSAPTESAHPPWDKVLKEEHASDLLLPPATPRAVLRHTSSLLNESAHTPRDKVAGDEEECASDGHDWENDDHCMKHRAVACPHCEEVFVASMAPKEAVRELRKRFMARALNSRRADSASAFALNSRPADSASPIPDQSPVQRRPHVLSSAPTSDPPSLLPPAPLPLPRPSRAPRGKLVWLT